MGSRKSLGGLWRHAPWETVQNKCVYFGFEFTALNGIELSTQWTDQTGAKKDEQQGDLVRLIKYSSQDLLDPRMLFGAVETVMAVRKQVSQRAVRTSW